MSDEVGNHTEPAEEEEGKGVVTMLDVLQDEEEQEENANAVLGAASETECSFSSGYVARQPLYSCTSCSSPSSPPAGLCLACSYHCHEGHTLVELYTKRDFRCDCGTSRLPGACRLQTGGKAMVENKENKYNQNFRGMYCQCSRPYPDPEEEVEDCMVQCVVCEDWHHGRHLGRERLPEDSSYSEMICLACVSRLPFLRHYSGLAVTSVTEEEQEEGAVDATSETSPAETAATSSSTEATTSSCPLVSRPAATPCSLFMPGGWRAHLCSCASCVKLYEESGTSFLTQEADTVHFYETQAKEAGRSQGTMERGLEALGQMDRVSQVEVVSGFNTMKDSLMEYLGKFADNKKVVREEDIREFFEEMKANKKQKTSGGPPPTCK